MTDITYRFEGDYLIPNLVLDDEADGDSEEMMEKQGVDEAMKVADQMAWVP